MNTRIIFAVVILITIISLYIYGATCLNNYLEGFWVSSDEFNKLSDIQTMMIYFNGCGAGHIMIMNDILNEPMSYNTGIPLLTSLYKGKYPCFGINLAKESKFFPDTLNVDVNIKDGHMLIYKDDKIYGSLIKDHTL